MMKFKEFKRRWRKAKKANREAAEAVKVERANLSPAEAMRQQLADIGPMLEVVAQEIYDRKKAEAEHQEKIKSKLRRAALAGTLGGKRKGSGRKPIAEIPLEKILELQSLGMSQEKIAKFFNVSPAWVSKQLRKGKKP